MKQVAKELGLDRFSAKTLNPSCGSSSDEALVPENLSYRRFQYEPGTFRRIRADGRCDRVWKMANVLSNGDVAPCCYDYDGSMGVGNIREVRLSEAWNGAAYRELRRRIHREMGSLEKCRDCGVNYK